MLIGFVIGIYDGALGPGTGSFLVLTLVGLMGYSFLEASAKAKIANLATNLGAITVFAPGGHIVWRVGVVMAVANVAGGYVGARTAVSRGNRFVRAGLHRRRRRLHRADRRRPPRLVVTPTRMPAPASGLWSVCADGGDLRGLTLPPHHQPRRTT